MPGNGQNTFEIASYLISLHSPCGFGFIISTMENSSKRLSKMPTAGEQQSQYGELCLDNDIPMREDDEKHRNKRPAGESQKCGPKHKEHSNRPK